MEDVANERKYAQMISEMNDVDFFLLEMSEMPVGDRIRHINGADKGIRTELRTKDQLNLALTDPKKALKKSLKNRGYSNEAIKGICDTYERITNERDMYGMQVQTARKAEDNPIGTTLSTYPAKLVGDVSSDITALTSNIASDWGLSTYSTMDVNHPGFWASEYVDTTRDTVSSNLDGRTSVAYQVGNDTVDGLLKDEVGELVGMPWLAVSGAYGEKARKASEYGASAEQSNALGLGSLGIAGVKEGVDQIIGQPETLQGKILQTATLSATEYAIEQIKQEALNNKPGYTWRVDKLMREGMDRQRAEEQAYYQMILNRDWGLK